MLPCCCSGCAAKTSGKKATYAVGTRSCAARHSVQYFWHDCRCVDKCQDQCAGLLAFWPGRCTHAAPLRLNDKNSKITQRRSCCPRRHSTYYSTSLVASTAIPPCSYAGIPIVLAELIKARLIDNNCLIQYKWRTTRC